MQSACEESNPSLLSRVCNFISSIKSEGIVNHASSLDDGVFCEQWPEDAKY